MNSAQLVLGTLLMLLGVGLVIASVFRSLNHRWGLGAKELLLPVAGIVLIVVGRWLVR